MKRTLSLKIGREIRERSMMKRQEDSGRGKDGRETSPVLRRLAATASAASGSTSKPREFDLKDDRPTIRYRRSKKFLAQKLIYTKLSL